jgi:hypothetical protein
MISSTIPLHQRNLAPATISGAFLGRRLPLEQERMTGRKLTHAVAQPRSALFELSRLDTKRVPFKCSVTSQVVNFV